MLMPAVFLDRDNTIIHNDGDLGDPDAVELIQGAASAIASLCGLGYRVVVVTNQGGVARGRYTEADVEAVHERIAQMVNAKTTGAQIDRFYYCPYHPDGSVKKYTREHPDRKPQPGMLLRATEEMKLDLARSWMIGDQFRDVKAGQSAGVRTVLLHDDATRLSRLSDTELRKALAPGRGPFSPPDVIVRTLIEAVRVIAQQRKPEPGDNTSRLRKSDRQWDAARIADLQRPRDTAHPDDPSDEQGDDPPEAKPFRPLVAPVEPDDEEPIAARIRRKRQKPKRAKPETTRRPEPEPEVEIEPEPEATEGPSESEPAGTGSLDPPVPKDLLAVLRDTPRPPPEQEEAPALKPEEEPAPEPPAPVGASTETDRLLRQLLHEVRQLRGGALDLGPMHLWAIGLQVMAIVCLLGGLALGGSDLGLFIRWLAVGLMFQIATVTVLVFARR